MVHEVSPERAVAVLDLLERSLKHWEESYVSEYEVAKKIGLPEEVVSIRKEQIANIEILIAIIEDELT